MIFIADTSPINYLVLIDAAYVLEPLFSHVVLPAAVRLELTHERTPLKVRDWITNPPSWLTVEQHDLPISLPQLLTIDLGERQAIALALAVPDARIIMDDYRGRLVAEQFHLKVVGTVGVLREAARAGLIHLPSAIARLKETRFHIADGILKDVLDSSGDERV